MAAKLLNNILSLTQKPRLPLLVAILLAVSTQLVAQTPISAIYVTGTAGTTTSYNATAPSDAINDITPSNLYTVRNGQGTNRNVRVDSFNVDSRFYTNFLTPDTVAIRRTDGSRFINIWYELITDPLTSNPNLDLGPDAVSDADAVYLTRNLNAGYDNILVNTDDEGAGAIQAQTERVDIIWRTGIVTCEPDSAIFPVIDRGGNDEVKVAAITSLDANGDPDGFSDLVLIQDSDWPGTGQSFDNFLILRRQTLGEDPIPIGNIGTYVVGQSAQVVQGVAVSFTDLGISANEVVYGYSIFASDVDAVSHDLTDINTFPNTTLASNSGLDLVAGITAAVSADDCLSPATGPGGYKASLATWLKANGVDRNGNNEVTSSVSQGASVTDWQDHWIGNNDFSTDQGTPTYNLTSSLVNFNPSVEFASASLALTNDPDEDFNSSSFYTRKGINIAIRTPTLSPLSSKQVIYEQGDGDRGINIHTNGTTLYLTAWNQISDGTGAPWNTGSPVNTISVGGLASDTEYIISLELDGNSSITGTARAYLNGLQIGTLSNVGLLFDHSSGDVTLGSSDATESLEYNDGSSASAFSFQGEIPEFIYCNEPGAFLLSQRRRIESYLAIKYGITLDQTSPINYLNSDGTVIYNTTLTTALGGYLTYNNDIAGIGRDDGSELSQLQSRSENSGSIVTMERGTDFPNDNTFLIWGNDGADFDDNTTTGLPTNIGRRVDRVWRVAETNSAGLVDISFDLSSASFTGSNYSLLIAGNSSAGSFSSAEIISGGTLNGTTLTFYDVDLSNGEFFTLGTAYSTNCGPGGLTDSEGLSIWLKADLGTSATTDSASVASWTNVAGSGNDATQGTESSRPQFRTNYINFNPTVQFDEGNKTMSASSGFFTQKYYIVITPDIDIQDETAAVAPLSFGATNRAGTLYLGDGLADLGQTADQGNLISHYIFSPSFLYEQYVDDTKVLTTDSTYIIGVQSDSVANSVSINLDGQILTTSSYLGSYNEPTESAEGYLLGANYNGTANGFFGKIAEVISFNDTLTALEDIKVQSYLSIKYGKTISSNRDGDGTAGETVSGSVTEGDLLASDEGVIWDYSDKSTYHNNVAGIGRDDGSCFEQKQSRSINPTSIVTMGLGEISTSNATNLNSFSADDSFLIWGSDGSDIDDTPVTTQLPGTVTERMDPIWRVQETGTVGDVTISFDLSGSSNYTSRLASDYQLIIASSGSTMPDLTGASTYSGGTFDGDVLTFTNIDFADGDYFTLGTARSTCAPGGVTANLAFWVKGDAGTDGTTDGSTVSSWSDYGGSGLNLSAVNLGGTNLVNPTYEIDEINFNPAVRFYDPNSTNGVYMESSGSHSVTGDMSVIVAFKSGQFQGTADDFQNSPVFLSTGSSSVNTDYGLGMASGRLYTNADNNNTFNAQSPSSPLYNTLEPIIATMTRVQAASGAIELYANSANVQSGTSSNTALNANSTFGIGNHPGSGNRDVDAQLSGRIGEVIVFSGVLGATERQRVESYLAIKYGITRDVASLSASEQDYLASDATTIFFDWDENATYRSDIAGVGRDDGSCLTQTISRSENNDALVTMEINSFGTDNSFLMWANDNADIESRDNIEFNTAQVKSRLNREWRVQETGTVGSATITFDLADISGPTGVGTNNLNEIVMMVDSDGDFTSGVTLIEATSVDAVNNTITFTYNFTDGQFFTLGSTEEFALPIELIAFNATALENQVHLSWTTASEENNAYFSVERSSDGEHFSTIGELQGAGTSNTILNYRYTDREPLIGRSYYRLKQIDFNGNFSYSNIKGVLIRAQQDYSLEIRPNPVSKHDELTIVYHIPDNGFTNSGEISIISLNGQEMFKESVSSGENEVTTTPEHFTPGIYLVILTTSEGTRLTKRLVIR